MSNRARKDRKARGEKFVRVPKVGTLPEDRIIPVVYDRAGKKTGASYQHFSKRYAKKLIKRIEERDARAS